MFFRYRVCPHITTLGVPLYRISIRWYASNPVVPPCSYVICTSLNVLCTLYTVVPPCSMRLYALLRCMYLPWYVHCTDSPSPSLCLSLLPLSFVLLSFSSPSPSPSSSPSSSPYLLLLISLSPSPLSFFLPRYSLHLGDRLHPCHHDAACRIHPTPINQSPPPCA